MDHVASGVGVLDKAMVLLDHIEVHQPLAVQDLVDAVGFPKTTTHRLVSALEVHGFVRRDTTGRLVTGARFVTASLSQIAAPILRQLSQDTGESSQLYVRRGRQRLTLVSVESRAELRTTIPVGALLTIERGSAGRVLTASEQELERGWIQSLGERTPGVGSVSAPVRSAGEVVAAVCVNGPLERLGQDPGTRYGRRVMAAAREIERAAGTSHY